jgi:hypothetical protein
MDETIIGNSGSIDSILMKLDISTNNDSLIKGCCYDFSQQNSAIRKDKNNQKNRMLLQARDCNPFWFKYDRDQIVQVKPKYNYTYKILKRMICR